MSVTIIDTNRIPFAKGPEGLSAEVLNRELCGAVYSHAELRSLNKGDAFDATSAEPMHQVIYFLEGEGVIILASGKYELNKGGGVYLAPTETAKIEQVGTVPLKIFHLTVPKKSS